MKSLVRDLKKWRFWRHFSTHSFASIGAFALILGLFDVVFPDVVPKGGRRLAVAVVVVSALYGFCRAWPRPIEQTYNSPNMTVRLVEGDLFTEPGHLVIGMADTFDTEVPDVISPNSIQAQFAREVFGGDLAELDKQLGAALAGQTIIGRIAKRGKTARYEIGTVVTLKSHMRRFFCLAYTEMNELCEARGTVDGIWRSLDRLWGAIRAQGNGSLVSIPVIGGGQARISQQLPAQDSIRFIALSFVLASRKEKVCGELNIVVRPAEYDKLDRLEIQSFLKSLRIS